MEEFPNGIPFQIIREHLTDDERKEAERLRTDYKWWSNIFNFAILPIACFWYSYYFLVLGLILTVPTAWRMNKSRKKLLLLYKSASWLKSNGYTFNRDFFVDVMTDGKGSIVTRKTLPWVLGGCIILIILLLYIAHIFRHG